MTSKYVYIYTIGCQMNVYDSDHMLTCLGQLGYQQTPELETADLVIMNTCTIRAKAEQKVYSFLGRLAILKKNKPKMIVGVGGCVAQQEGRNLLKRMPHLDFVFGTAAIPRLPGIINQVAQNGRRVVDIDMSVEASDMTLGADTHSQGGPSRFVTIMRGCDNHCAYCVVPYVRGHETSRRPEDILNEIESLANSGIKEVTLLGQNVNSYGKKEGFCSFSRLLVKINDIDRLLRIRFTTSHPKDFSDEIIYAFRDLPKLCKHLHLPVQSGSDRILRLMNRKYNREQYLEKIQKLRMLCPDVSVTTDIIVGFPGETTKDFNDTLELIKTVGYDSLFVFKYSDRPNAPAAHFPEKIPESEKQYRLEQVLALQEQITSTINQRLIGSKVVVLVDSYSKRHNKMDYVQWSGRTTTNKVVNFSVDGVDPKEEQDILGCMIPVKIRKALSHSFWGEAVGSMQKCNNLKGEKCYAA